MSELDSLLNEVLDGKYRLESLLGAGGMGAVFLATHLGTERPVAVKLIAPRFMQNAEFVERFRREARAAGRLRHPNVVDVTDFGIAPSARGDIAYLVMEYLDGCSLGDILAEEKRLPLAWSVDILEQVCSAVHEAHGQGIVHRDLKPDNIWLEPDRLGGYQVKVLDFGLAKLSAPPTVEPGEVGELAFRALGQTAGITAPYNGESATVILPADGTPEKTVAATAGGTMGLPAETQPTEASTLILNSSELNGYTEPGTLLLSPDANRTATHEERGTLLPDNDKLSAPTIVDAGAEAHARSYPSANSARGDGRAARVRNTVAGNAAPLTGEMTRVGAIMGTPTYMSPEQCRGAAQLDARTDIYSLGVIAYQMLAGELPFNGNALELVRAHQQDPPPPLRNKNKKVSKKIAALVMSALAKEPAQRPVSAEALIGVLRARSQGIGNLFQRALNIYSSHFRLFIKLSLLAHIPVFVLGLLSLSLEISESLRGATLAFQILKGFVGVLLFFVNYLAASAVSGISVLLVTQLIVRPMRQLQLPPAIAAFRRRWKAFITTSLVYVALFVFCFIVMLIPVIAIIVIVKMVAKSETAYLAVAVAIAGSVLLLGVPVAFWLICRWSLYSPVVLTEGIKNFAALRRSAQLVKRSWSTVFAAVAIQFLLPLSFSLVSQRLIGGDAQHGIRGELSGFAGIALNIFLMPFMSALLALLYLKVREIGGEPIKEALADKEEDALAQAKWQRRMRTRLTVTPVSGRTSYERAEVNSGALNN